MANNANSYKAQFCRQYFTQLKGFIQKFDVKRNNLGMKFLTEVDNKEYKWDNTVSMIDKNLMAAIEEYFYITDSNGDLQDKRETLLKGLIEPDKYASDQAVKDVFVEDITMSTILTYFGIKFDNYLTGKFEKIDAQIKAYNDFVEPIAYGGEFSAAGYNQALYLFKLNRNNKAHNIIRQEVFQRQIAFQYLAFTYIGLVYLLRAAWYKKESELSESYKKPEKFSIPEQLLRIVVNRKDSSNDNIIGYEFVPNINKDEQRIKKSVDPTPQLDITLPVRKYDKFKLIVKYGTSDGKSPVDITFGDRGDTSLSYYYWNPTWLINLPSSSCIQPGLSIGVDSTEELITKLLDDVNKLQEGSAKNKVASIVDEVLSRLEPTLKQIRELSEKTVRSTKEEAKLDEIVKTVNSSLQKQTDRMDENFKKLFNRMNEFDEKRTKEHGKLSSKMDDYFKELMDEIQRLKDQIQKEKLDTLRSDKQKSWGLWGKHGLIYFLILIAFGLFIYSWLFRDLSLSWLDNTGWWIGIPILLLIVAGSWLYHVYRTTVSNRVSIIRPQTKWISVSFLGVALLFYLLAIAVIPNKTIKSLVANFDFFESHDVSDNVIAAKLMETYLESQNLDNDENVRIKLTQYYLLLSGDKQKAFKISEPMFNDMGKYIKGVLAYAEVIYDQKDYLTVKQIIDEYKKASSEHNEILERLEGIMLCKGQGGYSKNVKLGCKLLKNATLRGDIQAKYLYGLYLTYDVEDWDPQKSTDGNISISCSDEDDMLDGVRYLQEASIFMPEASLALGSLYADLNMNDSAEYYFNRILNNGTIDDGIRNKAKYQTGLLYERMGKKDNPYMRSLKIGKYTPALLHAAMTEGNAEAIISIYDSVKYEGYRYLNPKAFAYLKLGQKDNARIALSETHSDAVFSMDFVEGLDCLLKTDTLLIKADSLKGMQYMSKAAEAGCEYAKMICLYRQLENKLLTNEPISSSLIEELDKMGDRIPFAHVLSSLVYRKKGDIYDAEWPSLMAASKGHPAGALGLVSSFKLLSENMLSEDASKWKQLLHYMQIALRKSYNKRTSVEYACNADINIWCKQKKVSYPYWRLAFWSDVTIANHLFHFECYLLSLWHQYKGNVEIVNDYKNKLVTATLSDIYKSSEYTNEELYVMSSTLNDLGDKEIELLKEKYKGDAKARTFIDERMHYDAQVTTLDLVELDVKLPLSFPQLFNELPEVSEEQNYNKNFGFFNNW